MIQLNRCPFRNCNSKNIFIDKLNEEAICFTCGALIIIDDYKQYANRLIIN